MTTTELVMTQTEDVLFELSKKWKEKDREPLFNKYIQPYLADKLTYDEYKGTRKEEPLENGDFEEDLTDC